MLFCKYCKKIFFETTCLWCKTNVNSYFKKSILISIKGFQRKIICAVYSIYRKFTVCRKTTPTAGLQLDVSKSFVCFICRLGRRPYGFCRNPCLKKDCPSNTICRRSSANRCRAVCKSKVCLNFNYYLRGAYADRNIKMGRSNFVLFSKVNLVSESEFPGKRKILKYGFYLL